MKGFREKFSETFTLINLEEKIKRICVKRLYLSFLTSGMLLFLYTGMIMKVTPFGEFSEVLAYYGSFTVAGYLILGKLNRDYNLNILGSVLIIILSTLSFLVPWTLPMSLGHYYTQNFTYTEGVSNIEGKKDVEILRGVVGYWLHNRTSIFRYDGATYYSHGQANKSVLRGDF